MKKNKILFFIEDIGGGGQQTFNYHLMKRMDSQRFELSTCYFLDGNMRAQFASVSKDMIQLNQPPTDWVKATKNVLHIARMSWRFNRLIRRKGYDLVVSNAPYTYFIAVIGCWLAGVRHARLLGKEPSKEKALWRMFNYFPFARLTDLFLSFSYGNKELKSKGVADSKLLDIVNAVDTEVFARTLSEAQKQAGRRRFEIPEDCLVIGWSGRIDSYMEVNNTVDMLSELLNMGFTKFRFFCIGDGPWMAEFKNRVRQKGLEPLTIYLGWQNMDNMVELLQYVDVMPLLDTDPIGGSIVREAMAIGAVVLSVDGKSGFQAEWVKNNENGILVKPDNYIRDAAKACIELYEDKNKRNRLSEAGIKYAKTELDFKIKAKIFEKACLQILHKS